MVRNTKLQANHRRNTTAGPKFASKAIGRRTPAQENGQARALLGGQPTSGTGWGAVPQGRGTGFAGTSHPLADGPFADAERFGNLLLGPALLLEVPGLEPSSFFPVGRCTVHT
jgi:hypothetical protein